MVPPMRWAYSHIYFCEHKYNLITRNALNNLKKQLILQFFARLFVYSHKNNIKMFWYYSHNILIRLLRSPKHLLLLTSVHWIWMKKQSSVIFELDNVGKNRHDCRKAKIFVCILFCKRLINFSQFQIWIWKHS